MQFNPISGQDRKSVPVTSPDKSLAADPDGSTSPRSSTAQLSCRSPNSSSFVGTALRMGSFYAIENSFTRLQEALKSDRKATRKTTTPALLNELQAGIRISTRDAEKAFTLRDQVLCVLNLDAAKSNQVAMLGKIDDIADGDISEESRKEIRSSCVELGADLTKMLIQAKTMELAGSLNSPPRARQKRAQGDANSPVLVQSPAKRQRNDTTASTSTATTTSASVLPSPSVHRIAPPPTVEQGATAVAPVIVSDRPAIVASSSTPSSQKRRPLSPQPRPRPPSQLFVAPPDFTRMIKADTTDNPPAAAPANGSPERRDGTSAGPIAITEQPTD